MEAPVSNGINIEVIWFDQDLVDILLSVSNGHFSGVCEIYEGHGGLVELADRLRGFPSSVNDRRTVELGTFNPDHADGGLRIHFYCVDHSGHPVADIQLRGGGCKALGEVESVALRMRVEAAGIDSFVQQLEKFGAAVSASAFLPMAQ